MDGTRVRSWHPSKLKTALCKSKASTDFNSIYHHVSYNHKDVDVLLPVPKWHYTILHQTVLRSSHVDMLLTREDAPRQSLRLSQAASTSDNTCVDYKTSRKNQKYKFDVSRTKVIHDSLSVSLHSWDVSSMASWIMNPIAEFELPRCRSNQHLSRHVGPCCPSSNAVCFKEWGNEPAWQSGHLRATWMSTSSWTCPSRILLETLTECTYDPSWLLSDSLKPFYQLPWYLRLWQE